MEYSTNFNGKKTEKENSYTEVCGATILFKNLAKKEFSFFGKKRSETTFHCLTSKYTTWNTTNKFYKQIYR